VVEAVRENEPAPVARVGVEVRQHLGHASVFRGEHRLHLRVIQLREDALGPGGGLEAHVEGHAIPRVAVGVAQAGHRLVEHVPGHPDTVEIEGGGPDLAAHHLREALARALLGEEEAVAVFVLHRLQLAHDVVGALLEPPVARGRPHEADGREVVAGDMAGEVVAVAVPALVWLRFRGQARPLAVEREHAVGLEMEQVLRVQVLRVFERPAREPHGGERQRPRDVGPRGRDLGRVTGAPKQEGDGTEEHSRGAVARAHAPPFTTTWRPRPVQETDPRRRLSRH